MVCGLLFGLCFPFAERSVPLTGSLERFPEETEETKYESMDPKVSASSSEIQQAIDAILTNKLAQFNTNQGFSQIYEPSLQAIYYALYGIYVLGHLNDINQTALVQHIMSYLNDTTGLFSDSYSERYLHTQFLFNYYPLTSFLQVNCYAILSLDFLGELTSENVDLSPLVSFIWDCYHPDTGGFIGQPYSASLSEEFKFSTMDNTYYAILALDALGESWDSHEEEREKLIEFIQSLQQINPLKNHYGGFENSHAPYPSMIPLDPNVWSSYYCMKSLDLLELDNAIDMSAFRQYLEGLYDAQVPGFKIDYRLGSGNDYNIIATAFGLQLSDLAAYSSYDRNGVVNFLLENRNSLGLWNSTTEFNLYELMDTFQVIRALYETGEISQLSSNEQDTIFTSIEHYFKQYRGYSLISRQYYTIDQLHAVVRAFHTWGKIAELNAFFPKFYERIVYLYNYRDYNSFDMYYFTSWINNDYYGSVNPKEREKDDYFRSNPIEFFSEQYHSDNNELGLVSSHKTTFDTLDTLKAIYKLGQFHNYYDLNEILGDIVESQFLNSSFLNYGGFLPNLFFKNKMSPEMQNELVFLEYSYYAIRALELIADGLGEDDIIGFGFNIDAFGSYINRCYLNGHFISSVPMDNPSLLRNTYYLVYIMDLIEPSSLTSQRKAEIKNFVVHHLNYTNMKNLYFCYKIDELLDLEVEFDFALTHQLVKTLYSPSEKDFFGDVTLQMIDHEILVWISDMAKKDEMTMKAEYPETIQLGTPFELQVTLQNIVLDYFGDNIELEYISNDSEISGFFTRLGTNYTTEILIPDKKDYYPLTQGEIRVTQGFIDIAQFPITFHTFSDQYTPNDSSETSQDSTDSDSENSELLASSTFMALPIMIALIVVPSLVMFLTAKKKSVLSPPN